MRITALLIPAMLAAGIAGSARGEEVDRYRLEKTETGYVRMDTSTGEMSICEERGGQLVCKVAAEEHTAFQDEVDRLQTKLDGLEGARRQSRETGDPRSAAAFGGRIRQIHGLHGEVLPPVHGYRQGSRQGQGTPGDLAAENLTAILAVRLIGTRISA